MKTTYEVNLAGTTLHFSTLRAAKAAAAGRYNVWRVVAGAAQLAVPVSEKEIDRRIYANLVK